MGDFRDRAYDSYVSSFKRSQLKEDESKTDRRKQEYDYRYMPFIREFEHSTPILELGCGPGLLLQHMREKGFTNITGIDISKEQVDIAQKKGLNVLNENALKFLKDNYSLYKVILAIDFIEHFSKDELFSLFSGINRSLEPHGVLIIQTPNGQGLFPGQVIYGDLTHMTIFAEDSLKYILQYHGFNDIKFYETAPIPNNLEGKMRLGLWKIIRSIVRIIRQIEAKNTSKIWTDNMVCVSKKIR